MRVTIDESRCQGHGRCFSIAPGLFESDELGNGVVLGDGIVAADQERHANLAVANCPEGAVSIEVA
ncbi:MAG TPA: ferredoxin [Acidimicrobiales bacterium]|jgi:ferredoxin|nr:ferredoxin [Acidimicrobiales bacterium]